MKFSPQIIARKKTAIKFFHNKLSMNSLNLTTKKLQSKVFDPMMTSVKGQCTTMVPSVRAIFKWTLVYASMISLEFSGNTKSWQIWHFCTTSNDNKWEFFTIETNFTTNRHLS